MIPPTGALVNGVHFFPVRIYFEDTDLSGIVYHANYLRYMERARSDMLRLAGIDQRAYWEAGDGAWALADLSIKYVRPAKLDDALVVTSRVIRVRAAAVEIEQLIARSGELVTRGVVTAALLGPDGRPKRQPKAWRDAFELLAGQAVGA
jgi:acyl-CoA thioester hydrolase